MGKSTELNDDLRNKIVFLLISATSSTEICSCPHGQDKYVLGNVLWSDETKLELSGQTDKRYVLRSKGEAFKPRNTALTVKQGGGSIMLWCCFVAIGTDTLHKVDGIMKKDFLQILQYTLKTGFGMD